MQTGVLRIAFLPAKIYGTTPNSSANLNSGVFLSQIHNWVAKMSKRILKILIRALRIGFFGERQIPSVPLGRENMQNCELLLNRSEMLSKLKKGGKVAEIGVAQGDFSELILEITEPDSLHLVDVWNSRRCGAGLFEKVTTRFKEQIDEGRIRIHRELSTDAAGDFDDNYFDWIYIDTTHSYDMTQ